MSQPLVYFRSDNHYQSPFTSTPFMQNQYPSCNGIHHKPLPPRRTRRKRKLEETDIEEPDINDSMNDNLIFMKPSNKRRRTNQMNSSNKQNPAIFQKEFEQNIYDHNDEWNDDEWNDNDSMSNNNKNNNKNLNNKNRNDDRMNTPYSHLIHPYLVNKVNKQNNDETSNDKEESPEYMLSKLNLNSFKMRNTQNESVNDWRDSIESQLKSARNQTSNIEELCQRINNTSGLGRDILMAKLRKSLTNDTFHKICNIMRINPHSR